MAQGEREWQRDSIPKNIIGTPIVDSRESDRFSGRLKQTGGLGLVGAEAAAGIQNTAYFASAAWTTLFGAATGTPAFMRRPGPPKLLKTITMLLPCVRSAAALVRQASVRAVPLTRRVHTGSMAAAATVLRARSSDLPLFYNDVYRVDLPEGHRFPMEKYRLVREVRRGWGVDGDNSRAPLAKRASIGV